MTQEDLIETLWEQFTIESEEHLEYLESSLLVAEGEGQVDVSALFRAFHSLKGLSRAMDLHAMEKVAHRSEDLLGQVRDGRRSLSPVLAALLLEGVDQLKSLRTQGVLSRQDGEAPEGLIQRLVQALQGDDLPVPAPPQVEEPPAPTMTNAQVLELEESDSLPLFAELLQSELPLLSLLLTEDFVTNADIRQQVLNSLDAVREASDFIGFHQMAALLAEMGEHLPASLGTLSRDRERLTPWFLEFRQLAEQVLQETQLEKKALDPPAELARVLREDVGPLFRTMYMTLERLRSGEGWREGVLDEDIAAEITRISSSVVNYLLFFECAQACYLMLLLNDVYHHVKSGRLMVTMELVNTSIQGLSLVESYFLATQTGETPPGDAEMKAVVNNLRKALLTNRPSHDQHLMKLFQDYLKGVEIREELLEILSPENIHDLMHSIREGFHPYELRADLEHDQAMTRQFLVWLQNDVRAITNRTLIQGSTTLFEYLVLSRLPLATLQQELQALDPGGHMLVIQACPLKATPGKEPEVGKHPPTGKERHEAAGGQGGSVIRVNGEILDDFMNQVGEMVILRSRIFHASADEQARHAVTSLGHLIERMQQTGTLTEAEADDYRNSIDVLRGQRSQLLQADTQLHSALSHLQEKGLALRVVPIDTVFKRFPRMVRDLAQVQGKDIHLAIFGQEVRIDKGMVDALVDPLMHMVRNSVDHGIEPPDARRGAGKPPQATITLKAVQTGNRVVVTISDNGRGIDADKVRAKAVSQGLIGELESQRLSREQIFQFIFQPGFSTADKVTETSGRGVGMDVVRTTIMRLGGHLQIHSEKGVGSTFTLELPLSAAIQNTLLVVDGKQTFAIPDRFVSTILEVEGQSLQTVKGRKAVLLRDSFLPVVPLTGLLGQAVSWWHQETVRPLVVISNGKHRLGLSVDRIAGRQEVFLKELHPQLAALPGVGGASILGDGRVVLVLDGEDLFRLAEKWHSSGPVQDRQRMRA